MAKKTSAAKIGAFVVGGVVIAIGVLLAVGSGTWFGKSIERAVMFNESLQGLQVGAPVSYNGIPVGEVERITGALAVDDNNIRTAVVLSLRGDALIMDQTDAGIGEILERLVAAGLRAQLATQSFVTGTLYVSLVFNPDAKEYKAPEEFLGFKTLPAVPSDRARLGRLANSLGEQLPQAIDQLSQIAERISATFDESNQANFSKALAGFAAFGDSLGAAGPQVDKLIGQASTAVGELGGLADRLDGLVANLDGAIDSETKEINATLAKLRQAVESFTAVMGRTRHSPRRKSQAARRIHLGGLASDHGAGHRGRCDGAAARAAA